MSHRLLLTGFGPFLSIKDNPSETLARNCDKPFFVIDVSYKAARAFVEDLHPDSFDTLLLMGVHGSAGKLRIETTARNQTEKRPDVTGFVPPERVIRHDGPKSLRSTLWPDVQLKQFFASHPAQRSYDAGRYLCNFLYYEALYRFPQKRIGFLHVPLETSIPLTKQQSSLANLIRSIEASR